MADAERACSNGSGTMATLDTKMERVLRLLTQERAHEIVGHELPSLRPALALGYAEVAAVGLVSWRGRVHETREIAITEAGRQALAEDQRHGHRRWRSHRGSWRRNRR